MIKFNARGEVVVPYFVVGEPEFDLAALYESVTKATKARKG